MVYPTVPLLKQRLEVVSGPFLCCSCSILTLKTPDFCHMLEWCKSGPGTEQFGSEHTPSVSVVCYPCSMLTGALPFLWVLDSVLTQKLSRMVWGCQVVEVNRLQCCSPDTWTVMGWDAHRKRGETQHIVLVPLSSRDSVGMKGKGFIQTLQVKQSIS